MALPSVVDRVAATGSQFTLTAVVRNEGDEASPSTTLRYYRSADATVATSDTAEGTAAVAGLAASGSSSQSVDVTAPSTAATYYYGACVDSVAGESDTSNNCSASVRVRVSAVEPPRPPPQTHPDLVVESPSVSDGSPAAGADFTLSATVRNAGDGASAGTTLRYYRSTDATITTSDTAAGTDPVGGLAASGSSSQSVDVTAPSSPGTYYYGACVDSVAGESDTANNCSASVQVTVSAVEPPPPPPPQTHPDLVVESPSVSDGSPAAGAGFTLSATVRNAGDGASAGTTLRYYRSTDATIATSDTAEGTDPVGGLAASGSSSQSVDVTAPSSPGTYYYGACVDSVAGESDTANNCSASVRVTVSAVEPPPPPPQTHPDLVVESPSVSDGSPAAGAGFTLSATVRNAGDGASAGTTLRYYRSTDAAITTSDTAAGTDPVGGLAASGSSSQSVDVTAPSTSGTYYYGACVDSVAGESDTANNCSASVGVTVSAVEPPPPPPQTHPDLVVESPSVSDGSPAAGAGFTLSATVRNAGDGASAGTTLRYYRSTDATVTTSDTEVGTDAIVGGLSAGASSSESIGLTAPSSSGTYYYGACVDSVTGESDTTNNCSGSVQVTVLAPPPPTNPDLVVGLPSVSDGSLETGDSFTLSATVENAGDGASAATTLRYYRSTDAAITTSDTEVGTDAVGGLSAGGSSGESIGLTAPSTAATYYYGACVDSVTGESDTTNNCSGSVQVTVSAPPPPPPPPAAAAPAAADQPGPGGGVSSGDRQQPGHRRLVHPVGDGGERR